MSKSHTDDEVAGLLALGEAVEHEDGSIRWGPSNSLSKQPGSLLRRPPQAAPLITTDMATEYAERRLDKRKEAIEAGFATGVGDSIGRPVTTDEALSILMAKLAGAGLDIDRRDYAKIVKILLETLEAMPKKIPGGGQNVFGVTISKADIQMLIADREMLPWLNDKLPEDGPS